MLGQSQVTAIIPISDRGRTIDFFTQTLGLRVAQETGTDIVFAAGQGTLIGAYESGYAGKAEHTQAAFLVDDLEAAMAGLRERGVTFEEYDLPGLKTVDGIADLEGERGAWFKDPDGNILALGERASPLSG